MYTSAALEGPDCRLGFRRVPIVVNLAGALTLTAGWWNGTNTVRLSTQLVWAAVGVVGVILSGCANLMWLRGWRVAILNRLARLAPRVALVEGNPSLALQLGLAQLPSDASGFHLSPAEAVAVDGGTYYHRPSCVLVAGKLAVGASIHLHESAGRRPCGICEP